MSGLHQQHYLDLGPRATLELVHARSTGAGCGITLAEVDPFEGWRESVHPKTQALDNIAEMVDSDRDVYFSMQSMTIYKGRGLANITHVGSCHADIDYYNVEHLAGKSPEEVLGLIQKANPTLPKPTAIASSGGGLYMVWTLTKGVSTGRLHQWQFVADRIVHALKEFGVDAGATKDAARVLRASGSFNTKYGNRAGWKQVGPEVDFYEVLRWAKTVDDGLKATRKQQRGKNNNGKATVTYLPDMNLYKGAHNRMGDLRKLASLRGGKFADYRKRVIFEYGCMAAYYAHSEESIRREITSFIRDCVEDPELYFGRAEKMTQVVMRFHEARAGGRRLYNRKKYDPRYFRKTENLIEILHVTQEEQRALNTLHTKTIMLEKKRAKDMAERRSEGIPTKAEQNAKTASERNQRAVRALQLHQQGILIKHIAEELGVTRKTVSGYLNKHREQALTTNVTPHSSFLFSS